MTQECGSFSWVKAHCGPLGHMTNRYDSRRGSFIEWLIYVPLLRLSASLPTGEVHPPPDLVTPNAFSNHSILIHGIFPFHIRVTRDPVWLVRSSETFEALSKCELSWKTI